MSWSEWVRTAEVEPSLYAADFAHLGDQIETLVRGDVRVFHYDVGDGYFVPPITIGPIVLESISQQIHDGGGHVDCHLMIFQPERHLEALRKAGADSVTVHLEACPDLGSVVGRARELGLGVGLAFNPQTEVAAAANAAKEHDADLVLCMSIQPGYSGQAFMPEALERIRLLRAMLPDGVHVQVDGGIGPEIAREVYNAGANLLVAGTAIFGSEDLTRAYRRLVQTLT